MGGERSQLPDISVVLYFDLICAFGFFVGFLFLLVLVFFLLRCFPFSSLNGNDF